MLEPIVIEALEVVNISITGLAAKTFVEKEAVANTVAKPRIAVRDRLQAMLRTRTLITKRRRLRSMKFGVKFPGGDV